MRWFPLVLVQLACTVQFDDASAPLDSESVDDTDAAMDGDTSDTNEDETDPPLESLVDAMDLERLLSHLAALQAIADEHSDTRVVGSSGFNQSADYVASQLEAAGFDVTWQEFSHSVWQVLEEPVLESDDGSSWDADDDFVVMSYSPGGEVTGPLAVIDVDIPPSGTENTSDSGCEIADFDGMAEGSVALIQRGSCTFLTKAQNAESAGAAGVIIFNEGQSGRQDVVQGTLGESPDLEIPVLGASYNLGVDLAEARDSGSVTIHFEAEVLSQDLPTWNLLADLQGETEQLLVVGAHLDSVTAGPGINDNGSGSALVLELALQAAAMEREWTNTLRFAWWGAEESGLVGSYFYVSELSDSEWERHLANLNFDMVASPNGLRFVYDGDNSNGSGYPAPEGSALIEDLFTDFLDSEGLAWYSTAFDGRSDYGPFIWTGIPAGGLFTGAEGLSAENGQTLDPCYHQFCDTTENLDAIVLDMARAAAQVTDTVGDMGSLSSQVTRSPSPRDLGMAPPEHHSKGEHGGCGRTVR